MLRPHSPRKRIVEKKKRALITGITGQDGSYLAELLLDKDYEVHGVIRRSSSFNTGRLTSIYEDPHGEGARLFLTGRECLELAFPDPWS